MLEPREQELNRIRRASRLVEVRMRASRAAGALPGALAGLAAAAGVIIFTLSVFQLDVPDAAVAPVLAAAAAIAALVPLAAASSRLPPRAGVMALDRAQGLGGRLANALEFAERDAQSRTALMEIAIDDACSCAGSLGLDAAAVAPIRAPKTLLPCLALAAQAAILLVLVARPAAEPATSTAGGGRITAQPPPHILLPEDIEAIDEMARDLARAERSPRTAAGIDDLRALLHDMAADGVYRTGVLRRIASIESALPPVEEGADTVALRALLDDLRGRVRQMGQADRHHARRLRSFSRRARGLRVTGTLTTSQDGDALADTGPDTGEEPPDTEDPPDEPADDPPPPPAPATPPPGPTGGVCEGPCTAAPPPTPTQDSTAPSPGQDDSPGPQAKGTFTSLNNHALGTRARAHDTGHGRVRSAVVFAAAERGFLGAPYADTFREYRAAARDWIDGDTAPDGYRWYVRRYFALIRPRD